MSRRRHGQRGTRKIDGRYFLLAGRGSKAECQASAERLRRAWRYVRIVPAAPFFNRDIREILDDWMLYVFEQRRPATPAER